MMMRIIANSDSGSLIAAVGNILWKIALKRFLIAAVVRPVEAVVNDAAQFDILLYYMY